MFHDHARLTVVAGGGGDGSIHFRREKYVPRGGPDGGDGGAGGDVVLVADPRRRDLSGFRPNQKLRAGRGGAGGGQSSNGARGVDAVLAVPVGTQVFDGEELAADLAQVGARVVVAKGGTGGRGNKHFAGPSRQTPRFAEVGLPVVPPGPDLGPGDRVAQGVLHPVPAAGGLSLQLYRSRQSLRAG